LGVLCPPLFYLISVYLVVYLNLVAVAPLRVKMKLEGSSSVQYPVFA
jgi:hypothetical protein